jgi:hypothetical protein
LGLFVVGALLASCASQSESYRRLPGHYTAIPSSSAGLVYVFEINPAFSEPIGYRFEFPSASSPGGKMTVYSYRGSAVVSELEEEDVARYRKALLAFDWNRVENVPDPAVVAIVPDDIGILFRARLGGVYHEARVGLSTSSAVDRLLHDLDIFK